MTRDTSQVPDQLEGDPMPDLIVITDGLAKFGGNVVKTSLSTQDEAELQDALHGTSA